ncbi:hypothetical protein [Sphingobium scionense]|uniref:Uncharacterized protein n=1 Tax=Sphingobium scionense TaxID=1404341 RepID=A0A7W6PWG8_9SPHN|nr:hypothetical protein [Sphingobium scionense]MBB4149144.1 hypothetical protein [Sphingobium scionense]
MKIPVGKIAAWIGRTIAVAFAQAAIDRLTREGDPDDRRDDSMRRDPVPSNEDRAESQV